MVRYSGGAAITGNSQVTGILSVTGGIISPNTLWAGGLLVCDNVGTAAPLSFSVRFVSATYSGAVMTINLSSGGDVLCYIPLVCAHNMRYGVTFTMISNTILQVTKFNYSTGADANWVNADQVAFAVFDAGQP